MGRKSFIFDTTAESCDRMKNSWGVDVVVCCRAAAYSKLGNYAGAVQDCERAINIDPNYSKAYGRMG